MKRSSEHMLTTHTGSLPRPPALMEELRRRDRGEGSAAGFDAHVRDAVADVVRRQVDAGLSVVNDGEAGKIGYGSYVKERLDGFGGEGGLSWTPVDMEDFPGFLERVGRESGSFVAMPKCVGPVAYRDVDAVRTDVANLKAAAAGVEADELFMSAASPGVISVFLQNEHYDSHEEYVWALADAMKTEYDAIHEGGIVLQLDCPHLAIPTLLPGDETFEGFRRRARMHVEALNHATRDIPSDAMRMHICWGNYEGPHHHDVPLRDIIDIVLEARPAGILIEGANPRHEHEWAVFEDVELPDGKVLIPGVIDTTTNYIEHPELVAQRIVRYARLVGRENVIAGSDCGFATVADLSPVEPSIAWAKLAALADGAELASAELW
jgi:5-methyltetrahydropteroyltriglutamate--homocysteine methyltransferase